MFFLTGPTGVGKTELAVEVALRCGCEIIGADAFQIYRGLEILTGQPERRLHKLVAHHLIGEIPSEEKFDAARYRELALKRIGNIESRGKRALVVGGTGLYIRALTRGFSDMPGADPALRRELDALSLAALQEHYAKLDPAGNERIDRRNRRRLVRAIEVSMLAGKPYSALRPDWNGKKIEAPGVGVILEQANQEIGGPRGIDETGAGVILERDRQDLYSRIDSRVCRMFAEGAVEEVQTVTAGETASQAIGYAEISRLLAGGMSLEECISAVQQRTRRYAKRQLTWLRGENMFFTIDLSKTPQSEAVDLLARRIGER